MLAINDNAFVATHKIHYMQPYMHTYKHMKRLSICVRVCVRAETIKGQKKNNGKDKLTV